MSEQPQEMETLFIQTLGGHAFVLQAPPLQNDVGYAQLIMNIQTMGYMVCGEVRIPWSSIAFIARGETAQSFIQQAQMRPISVASMMPQGVA